MASMVTRAADSVPTKPTVTLVGIRVSRHRRQMYNHDPVSRAANSEEGFYILR